MVPSDEDSDFHNIATQLIQDAEDADIPNINDLPLQLFAVLKSFLGKKSFLSSNARFFISPYNIYLLALNISGFTLHRPPEENSTK
jgi:hypothetical protein